MYFPYRRYRHPYDDQSFAGDFPCYTHSDFGDYPHAAYSENPNRTIAQKDFGREPFVTDIEDAAKLNTAFRAALWTGNNLQLTLMSINVGEDIGLESHPHVDQFIRIEDGKGLVEMGDSKDQLNYKRRVDDDYVILIPAGKWHNLTNIGNKPLKLYSIYAPPEHPFGALHQNKKDAEAAEVYNAY